MALKSLKFACLPIFLLANFSACSFWQTADNSNSLKDSELIAEVLTDIPFSTKEPENFQAEIVVSGFTDGGKTEQNYFIAKSGEKSLQKFYAGSENERSILRRDENEIFLINNELKNYREISGKNSDAFSDDSLIKNLTSKLLNEKASAGFEKLGTQENLTKYRVKFEDAKNSEIIIFVDEKIKLPVKQEFYSVAGDKKTLTYQIEIKNFKPQADDKLFELPKNYRRIDAK